MFTPINTSLGAILLFQSSSSLLFHNGSVFGISSLLSGCLLNPNRDNVPIIAGLMSSVLPVYLLAPSLIPNYVAPPYSLASVAVTMGVGFLLGWGTKNGHGCTSGHMLCGISRLSSRSFIATALFFTSALITANFAGIPSCGPDPCYTPVYPSAHELIFMGGAVLLSSITNDLVIPKALKRSHMARVIFSFLAGLEFGLGLFISGMADPLKVLRFFAFLMDISRFDPSLALIMVFGIGPSLVKFCSQKPVQVVEGKIGLIPTLAERWSLPTATVADIDWRFVAGSVTFGIAWGLKGVCPGPAILRAIIQPTWGFVTMSGFVLGNLV
ncbi:hypothetical protein N7495_006872 [Penicillium taxi]|uniref:uncharacterized protein n=1 Tax=Penicillium taxi TaxID=168475 RepID=UPI002545B533|nr:uncharacterized protein N7495_006872 [Penicillium taxi]KAJ5895181.1 hypothetical protein N7495_006872 [Penicillium taxi]